MNLFSKNRFLMKEEIDTMVASLLEVRDVAGGIAKRAKNYWFENICDRDDVRFDGLVGHRGCPQFEEAFREARKQGGV